MKHFANIDDLTDAFIGEDFLADPKVRVGDNTFALTAQTKNSVVDTLNGKRPLAVYTNEQHGGPQIVLFWAARGGSIVPSGVVITDKELIQEQKDIVVEMNGEKITLRPDQLIGDIATIKITSFTSPRELKAKVDTGATISSLHADSFKINGNSVTFVCSPLGPNSVTVPLKTQHAVKSPDGGTHYRPVIELNVKVNGKLMNNVLFNLNDRGNMDQPVLLGQNILQQGKFFVDPTRNESVDIDWTELEKLVESAETETRDVQELYKLMLASNVSLRDLVRHIRSEVIKTDLEA